MANSRIMGVLGCVGLILAACSGDDGSSTADAGSPVAREAGAGNAGGGGTGVAGATGNASRGRGGGSGGSTASGGRTGSGGAGTRADGGMDAGGAAGVGLAGGYPGDVGLGDDPAVVWFEDFEQGSLAAIAARYDQVRDEGRWELVSDTPSGDGSALAMRAGQGQDAVDLYKRLPDGDEWYVRWYAKYEAGVPWHHSGMWFGGYRPSMPYPSPMAGNRPDGDDRFSLSVEPVHGIGGASPRFDFYNYWMAMHSWMAEPISDDGTAYYGNGLIHSNDFSVDPETWVCLEVHVRLNTAASSAAGARLEVWKNDGLVQSFGDDGPLGYWIRDKFCPEDADGTECTDYPAPATEVLDLQQRSTTDLHLNAFWPQNYITDDAMGTLTFDQMVVATQRIGCIHR